MAPGYKIRSQPASLDVRRVVAGLVVLLTILISVTRAATVDRYWEVSPYRIQLLIDYDSSHIWQQRLSSKLPEYLARRASVAMGPLWKLEIDQLSSDAAAPSDGQLAAMLDEQLADVRRKFDKLIVLRISESVLGFTVSAEEYDCLLERWGPERSDIVRDGASILEVSFAKVQQAFTTMATFRVVRETPDKVTLVFRGAGLPSTSDVTSLASEGQILQPIMRRVDRDGIPVENGIQVVPWTYLSVDTADSESQTATIVSHTRAPLGVRQRGRVDQIAALVKPGDRTSRLRLHARNHEDQPLAGFRVYQRDSDVEDQQFVGKTGDDGSIEIQKGKSPIQVVFVQSSGQWIAKIPIVPGVDTTVDAPLADDRKRLEAEAKLVGIREELIDIVARRNILAARTRVKIKANDIEGARALIRELEQMPTATEFEQQRIRQQERLIKSSDPAIQKRIEKMFSDTRDVLAEFLAPGLIQQLKQEVASGSTASQ